MADADYRVGKHCDSGLIISHYQRFWGVKGRSSKWKLGPTWQLPADFKVLTFAPTENKKMWIYATSGMSGHRDAPPIELHLFSPIQTEAHVELLTVIAHYHLTGEYIGVGHAVNFGRPWLPASKCDHGLISLPYLEGPQLEWVEGHNKGIHFLWLIPITTSEAEFKRSHGLEALESRFEACKFNYLDPLRESVV
jgi:hypothetical protein